MKPETGCGEALAACEAENVTEWGIIKGNMKDALSSLLWEKTKRRPMIMPIIMEV